eukprot:4790888-Pyramimonas_sp.AAC.1
MFQILFAGPFGIPDLSSDLRFDVFGGMNHDLPPDGAEQLCAPKRFKPNSVFAELGRGAASAPAAPPPPEAAAAADDALSLQEKVQKMLDKIKEDSPNYTDDEIKICAIAKYLIQDAKMTGFHSELDHQLFVFLMLDGINWRAHAQQLF